LFCSKSGKLSGPWGSMPHGICLAIYSQQWCMICGTEE
jgi:hypothetical protein